MRPVNLHRNTILKIIEAQKDYKYRIEKQTYEPNVWVLQMQWKVADWYVVENLSGE